MFLPPRLHLPFKVASKALAHFPQMKNRFQSNPRNLDSLVLFNQPTRFLRSGGLDSVLTQRCGCGRDLDKPLEEILQNFYNLFHWSACTRGPFDMVGEYGERHGLLVSFLSLPQSCHFPAGCETSLLRASGSSSEKWG